MNPAPGILNRPLVTGLAYVAANGLMLVIAAFCAVFAPAASTAPSELMVQRCGGCHTPGADGWPDRIGAQRKTPEGWLMTIVRMRLVHGLSLAREEQRQLVYELSEARGLAPSEAAPWRYILERQPGVEERFDTLISPLCARCHSRARTGLQRRSSDEWSALVHFHVGQYPTLEYQGFARDRDWWEIALNRAVPVLAKRYPFRSEAWDAWRVRPPRHLQGRWLVSGEDVSGDGLVGWVDLTPVGPERAAGYRLAGNLTRVPARHGPGARVDSARVGGVDVEVRGNVRLYGGFEWRASLRIGAQRWRQVGTLAQDGLRVAGRQFLRGQSGLGGRFVLSRNLPDNGQALDFWPRSAPLGTEVTLLLVGTRRAALDVPAHLAVIDDRAVPLGRRLIVRASRPGVLRLRAHPDVYAAFFDRPDRLTVEPAANLARVGGGGARVSPKAAGFRARAWGDGVDGRPGTDDDVSLGIVPARWSSSGWDRAAEALEDVRFAGVLDATTGVFTPAAAGPNPARRVSGGGVLRNNHGNLRITAQWRGLSADGQLIITAPRWNDPPIH